MSWTNIVQSIFRTVATMGGVGALIFEFTKYLVNKYFEKLMDDHKASINKEIEKFKSEISKKEYVTKTRFDAEFDIYRKLSLAFSEMVKFVNILIPKGYAIVPKDREDKLEYEHKYYELSRIAVVKAQDTLNSNIPFMSENIYEEYSTILHLSQLQLQEYEQRFVVTDCRPQEEKEQFSQDAYRRTEMINNKWIELNKLIREYISKLDVME